MHRSAGILWDAEADPGGLVGARSGVLCDRGMGRGNNGNVRLKCRVFVNSGR